METTELLTLITIVVSFILGIVSKKVSFIDNNLIPVQNLLVGTIMACVNYAITKDFNASILVSGLLSGGAYDLVHNLDKIINKKDEEGE